MKPTGDSRVLFCLIVLSLCAARPVRADRVIRGVPDWHQPNIYVGTAGAAGLSSGDYPDWCSPTAAAALVGYWEDVLGATGLTDRQAAPASAAYAAAAGTWQQGLWHDGVVEIGWYMDTGKWAANQGPFPPRTGGTYTNRIGSGVVAYAQAAWTDATTGAIKVAFPQASHETDRRNDVGMEPSVMWSRYVASIDAGLPVLASFWHWVDVGQAPEQVQVDGVTVEKRVFGNGSAHTVVGVGYIDPTPGQILGDEWFIVQDNWSVTGQYVAVSLSSAVSGPEWRWLQNDFIYIPEPSVAVLLLGGLALTAARRRRAA